VIVFIGDLNVQEPAYTNWAQTRGSPPFMGTLDYIFVSEGCKATDVLPLPNEVMKPDFPFVFGTHPPPTLRIPPRTPKGGARPRWRPPNP
jgi:hypothetical protein